MDDADFAALRAYEEPFHLDALVPGPLREIVLRVVWSSDALHALGLPVEELEMAALTWQLALPWWRSGRTHFGVSPEEVRADPVRHAEQWQRTLDADLGYPIDVIENRGRLTILDGVHRLLKATIEGRTHLRARRVTRAALWQISTPRSLG